MENENIYDDYFDKQVGSGIAAYSGDRYYGNGWLKNILNFFKPATAYIQRQGLNAIGNMAKNIANGDNLNKAFANQLFDTTKTVMNDGIEKIEKIKQQKGSGIRKRKKKSFEKKSNDLKRRKLEMNKFFN
jgi:hypothetical protein